MKLIYQKNLKFISILKEIYFSRIWFKLIIIFLFYLPIFFKNKKNFNLILYLEIIMKS